MATQDKEKKKGISIKEALFGGSGTSGNAYRVIYFSIVMYMGPKGPEQYAVLLYGDDEGAIFSNTLPAQSIVYSYNEEVDGPYIKLSKSFMPGSSKAEIVFPKAYSYMAPSMPTVYANMPKPEVQYVESNDRYRGGDDLPSSGMSTDDVIRMIQENEARAKEEKEQLMQEEAERMAEQASNTSESKVIPDLKPEKQKRPAAPNIIQEADPFVATFDSDILNEKINRFMEKHEAKPAVEAKPVKEVDPRSIGEVKRESVEDEMERLTKNADHIRKIGEAADEDAAAGKDKK